jgi:hypothetical protein
MYPVYSLTDLSGSDLAVKDPPTLPGARKRPRYYTLTSLRTRRQLCHLNDTAAGRHAGEHRVTLGRTPRHAAVRQGSFRLDTPAPTRWKEREPARALLYSDRESVHGIGPLGRN